MEGNAVIKPVPWAVSGKNYPTEVSPIFETVACCEQILKDVNVTKVKQRSDGFWSSSFVFQM